MPGLRVSPTIYTDWQITDFNNLPKETDYYLESAAFSLSGALWCISMYPNGESEHHTAVKWVGLYLSKLFSAEDYRVSFKIGIKKADGVELEYFEDEDTFSKGGESGLGTAKLLKRSTLNSTQNVVASDGSLTVFCSIRILNGPFILPAKEAATQTSSPNSITEETSLQSPLLDSTLTLVEDFENLYRSKLYTDVTFTVKGENFSVHKNVLASRSPVFASMFKHDFAEKSSGIVEINDCDPDSFDQFLLFLYTGKIEDMATSKAVHLYVTADKYSVKELKEKCAKCMVADVSICSFCDVLHLAVMHNDSDLLEAATDFFLNNLELILPTAKWQDFLTEHPLLCNELLIKEIEYRMAKK